MHDFFMSFYKPSKDWYSKDNLSMETSMRHSKHRVHRRKVPLSNNYPCTE